ncbi:MAG: hypothetical protein Q8K66_05610 [Sediminibacterium sp.]|nr:hypothetical protein [Sediminibacterium sp.]
MIKLLVGDKVTFDNDKIELFKSETNSNSIEITQYQKLVLSGIDQIGTFKEFGENIITVFFDDGWELPIPTKYLLVLPK